MSFLGMSTSMTLSDLEPLKIGGFSEFCTILGSNMYFKSELHPNDALGQGDTASALDMCITCPPRM